MAVAVLPERSQWTFPKEHLSPSQVWLMTSCGECYRLSYIEGKPQPPSEHLVMGSAVHTALALQREQMLDGQYAQRHPHLRIAAFLDAASDSFDEAAREAAEAEPQEEWPDNVTTDLAPYKDTALRLAHFAVEALAPIDLEATIVAVEQRVFGLGTPLDEQERTLMAESGIEPILPFPFRAYADMVCLLPDGRLAKTDTKTSKDSRKPEWWPRCQMTMYTLPEWRNGIEVAGRIDQITKAQNPAYIPLWVVGLHDEWRQRVIDLILNCAEDISAGRFRMRPSYSCPFSHGAPGLQVAVSGFGD